MVYLEGALEFTRIVSKGRRKPKLVVNIDVSKDGDLHEWVKGRDVLYFGS